MQSKEWRDERLDWSTLPEHPMDLFAIWHEDACKTEPWEAGAMLLATATPDGSPSARIVLMRGFHAGGIRFFTNYESRKGQHLTVNPRFAATFWWPTQVRQIRAEGRAERLSRAESEAYFAGRPRGSQLGAWSSPQSQTIGGLGVLQEQYNQVEQKYRDQAVPCPPFWGGYLLKPSLMEFWQGGANRLHDRIVYKSTGEGWALCRQAP